MKKDNLYENSKIFDFDNKFQELKENLQKPNELKEYEDFDLKCIETSFHQQQTELKRKLSNKRNVDVITPLGSNDANLVATAAASNSLRNSSQQKRTNIDVDIRPCEPNENFNSYRTLVNQNDNQQYEHNWFSEPMSMSTTRAIVERRPITPSDEEASFA